MGEKGAEVLGGKQAQRHRPEGVVLQVESRLRDEVVVLVEEEHDVDALRPEGHRNQVALSETGVVALHEPVDVIPVGPVGSCTVEAVDLVLEGLHCPVDGVLGAFLFQVLDALENHGLGHCEGHPGRHDQGDEDDEEGASFQIHGRTRKRPNVSAATSTRAPGAA